MRTISAPSLAKLATQLGTEPINIVEIQWVDGGPRVAYADRDIAGGIKGTILSLSGLDDVVQVSGGSQSQQISLTLDDTDGSLKGIMDSTDIHKRPCWVYQWFNGIATTDKFLIFKGVLNTPIEWDEGARTVKLDVISKIEDVEIGFSIEEGDFVNPPEELIGKPWPLCFGTCINVPALRTQSSKRGILAEGTGIRDFTLERRLRLANLITCPDNFTGYRAIDLGGTFRSIQLEPQYEQDAGCLQSKCEAIESLTLQQSEQAAAEFSPIRIFGGSKFPQNTTITLNINGGKFTGKFSGEMFTITGRLHPDNDGHGNVITTTPQQTIQSACGARYPAAGSQQDLQPEEFGVTATLGSAESKASWEKYQAVPTANFFWANAGSTVTIDSDEEILYIANLLPSTVLRVAAYRELNGGRALLTVPSDYYTVRSTNYTGYTGVVEIVFDRPLSSRDLNNGGGWSDDIYVTLTSTVGPNTVDIIQWFIEFYTNYSVDSTSFNAVRTLIDNYPMHFPLLERKNIINVLEEIAYQARCALWLKDDVFYIKYLALEPDADDTITEDDVTANSLRIEHTSTEDLITKYVAKWKSDYAVDKNNTVILRHNVKRYGTHEQEFDYYCFNILDLVRKAATFWLIRKANTWRRAIFKTPMHKLNLETFDTVSITLPDAASGTIKGVVEKANYNSDSRTMDFEVWTPCKSGTNVPYNFAWPADIEELDLFPTIEERTLGLAGSGTGPNFHTIAPNGHPLANNTSGLFQGFSLACNGDSVDPSSGQCRPDHGDKHPSDRNDVKPTPNATTGNGGSINIGTSPITSGSSGNNGNCCQAAMDLAKQALNEAQEARTQAESAAKSAGRDQTSGEQDIDDAKSQLPQKCGGNCEMTVQVTSITPTLVVLPPGSATVFGTEDGDSGNLATGIQGNTECFTFNSRTAALAFVAGKQAEIDAKNNYGWVVGTEGIWQVTHDPDLGVDNDPESDNFGNLCPEPAGEDQAMTGYSPDV
jgi:hypothetical protein